AVEFFSSFTRLAPGDVIATGTPGGVGFARTPPVWMEPGVVIEVTVEGIGTIRNRVVAEQGGPGDWRERPAGAPGGLCPAPADRRLARVKARARPPGARPGAPLSATACPRPAGTRTAAVRRRPRRAGPGPRGP